MLAGVIIMMYLLHDNKTLDASNQLLESAHVWWCCIFFVTR